MCRRYRRLRSKASRQPVNCTLKYLRHWLGRIQRKINNIWLPWRRTCVDSSPIPICLMTKLFNAAMYQGVAEEMIRKMFEPRDVSLEFAIAFEIDVALH